MVQLLWVITLDFDGETNIIDYLHRDNKSTHQGIFNTEGSFLHILNDGKKKFYINYYYLNIHG